MDVRLTPAQADRIAALLESAECRFSYEPVT
jgi:hypothetical protein